MLHWAIVFIVLAIIAAFLGFGGIITGSLVLGAKICFFLFLVLFVLSLVGGWNRPSNPPLY